MTKEELETEKLKELSKKYKGARCSQYCSVWNSEDRDCEIMGSYHLSPSRCRHFLMQELREREGNEMTKFTVYLRTKTEDNAIKSQKLKWECLSTEDALHLAVKVFESREVVGMTIWKGSRIIMTLENGGAEPREKRIADLEKENTELKERHAEILEAFVSASSGDDFEMAESAREIMEILNIPCYRHGKVVSKLTKAKALLAKWVELYKPKSKTALPTPIQIDTEQFLKEV